MTDLVKDRGCRLTAAKANRILVAKGVLEERERPSSSSPGGVQTFKALTELGLRYGVNVTNPNAPGETSSKYFPALFAELLEKYLNESSAQAGGRDRDQVLRPRSPFHPSSSRRSTSSPSTASR